MTITTQLPITKTVYHITHERDDNLETVFGIVTPLIDPLSRQRHNAHN